MKHPLPRRDSSKEGLRELAKLLALDGAVVGKGEMIERNHVRRKPHKLDSITQADSFCIHFETKQQSIEDEDEEATKKRIDFAYSKNMVAQIIDKLETHKKTLQRNNNIDISFEKKVLKREENFHNSVDKKLLRREDKLETTPDKRILKREDKVEITVDKKLLQKEDNTKRIVDKKLLKREKHFVH